MTSLACLLISVIRDIFVVCILLRFSYALKITHLLENHFIFVCFFSVIGILVEFFRFRLRIDNNRIGIDVLIRSPVQCQMSVSKVNVYSAFL